MTTGTRTDSVLAAIDGALEDYDTSVDAMRWTPRTVPTVVRADFGGFRGWTPSFVIVDEVHQWTGRVTTVGAALRQVADAARGAAPAFALVGARLRQHFAWQAATPVVPRRVEVAQQRRVAVAMRRRARRAARHGRTT